jgi:hypothetical protein
VRSPSYSASKKEAHHANLKTFLAAVQSFSISIHSVQAWIIRPICRGKTGQKNLPENAAGVNREELCRGSYAFFVRAMSKKASVACHSILKKCATLMR